MLICWWCHEFITQGYHFDASPWKAISNSLDIVLIHGHIINAGCVRNSNSKSRMLWPVNWFLTPVVPSGQKDKQVTKQSGIKGNQNLLVESCVMSCDIEQDINHSTHYWPSGRIKMALSCEWSWPYVGWWRHGAKHCISNVAVYIGIRCHENMVTSAFFCHIEDNLNIIICFSFSVSTFWSYLASQILPIGRFLN